MCLTGVNEFSCILLQSFLYGLLTIKKVKFIGKILKSLYFGTYY